MINIDKYYNRIVERINNTDNKYLKNFERGAITTLGPIQSLIELHKPREGEYISLCSKINKPIDYPNNLTGPEHLAYIGGVVAGTFFVGSTYLIPWFITGTLDATNYLQRKSKE